MKPSTIVLFGSLAVNTALLGLLIVGGTTEPVAPDVTARERAARDRAKPGARLENGWASVGVADLAVQRDRLAAEGFPPDVIRAIVASQIHARNRTRWNEINQVGVEIPFWRAYHPDPKLLAASMDLHREERKELEALLGPDPEQPRNAELQRRLPQISAEKLDRIADILEEYQMKRSLAFGSPALSGQRLQELEKAQNQEIAQILTPQEFEEYNLRQGSAANQLAYQLQAFDPSEEEFRAIAHIRGRFRDQTQYQRNSTPEQMKGRSEAEKQMNEQIAAALGPTRYADYVRATDYSFQQTSNVVDRLGLPKQVAVDLYDAAKDFQSRRDQLLRGATGGSGIPTDALRQLEAEAKERVGTLLGGDPRAIAAYQEYGGSWLRNLVPALRR
jgi:hypothetical protein